MRGPVAVSDAERRAIMEGSTGADSLVSSFWTQEENRSDLQQRIRLLHDTIRASGFAGDSGAIVSAIDAASAFIDAHQSDADISGDIHIQYGGLMSDILRHRRAAKALTQADVGGRQGARLRAAAQRLRDFARHCEDITEPARLWLSGKAAPDRVAEADLGIIAPYQLLCTPRDIEPGDLFQTLAQTVLETRLQAQRNGLKLVAIPDFAMGLLTHRPPHVLSFHTAGLLPGFLHFKRGDLPGYMVLDRGGYSGWSSLSGVALSSLPLPSLAEALPVYEALRREIVAANVSKYSQEELTAQAEPLPDDYVFVAMQVTGDKTQRVARFTMDEMLDIVIDRFRGTSTRVVVKPHPKSADLDQLARLMALAEAGDILLRFDSIHRLISQAGAVITVNSGVGSETLLHGKPLYCFGAADYDSVAHRIASAAEFNSLTSPIHPAVSPEDMIRFAAYYRKTYLVARNEPGRLAAAIRERVIAPILAARQAASGAQSPTA